MSLQADSRRGSYNMSSTASSADNSPARPTYRSRIRPLHEINNNNISIIHNNNNKLYVSQYNRPQYAPASTIQHPSPHSIVAPLSDSQGKIKPLFSGRLLYMNKTMIFILLSTLILCCILYIYPPISLHPSSSYTTFQLNRVNKQIKSSVQRNQGELVEFVKTKSILPTHLNTTDKSFSAIEYALNTRLDLWSQSGNTSEWDPPPHLQRVLPQAVIEGTSTDTSNNHNTMGSTQIKIAQPKQKSYSKMSCMNSRDRSDSYGDRSCEFHNLCYNIHSKQWIYHQDPNDSKYPILIDNGELITHMPDKLLNLRSMGNPSDARYWSPHVVSTPIDQASYHGTRNDINVLYHPHYPSNIGHIIGDDYFAIYNLLMNYNYISHNINSNNNIHLIPQRSCEEIFTGNMKKINQCRTFMSMLLPGMTKHNYTDLTHLTTQSTVSELCYYHVVAGTGPYGFQQSLGRATLWKSYRAYYLSNMGLNPYHTPKQHRITISIKSGKRGIYNNQELIAGVKQHYVPQNILVDAIELVSLGSWKAELNYLSDTTVLVTPCGGVSMSSMFLPVNSALVVVDYWNPLINNTNGMEDKLWSNLGTLQSYHYPFTESEVMLDTAAGYKRGVYEDMRNWGQVKIDIDRMITMIDTALRYVDQHMVLGK